MSKVDNAVIMAAGTASRFAPLSYEMPKALANVKGEILIERQIKQLQEAGIREIYIVVGYMKEKYQYLEDKYGVQLVENKEYLTRNNNSSLFVVKDFLKNTYICSADNYFPQNPFESEVEGSYYAALFSEGETKEWVMTEDADGYINSVTVGGKCGWYMMGHAYFSSEFSNKFRTILENVYELPETRDKYWEDIFIDNLDVLKMRIRQYKNEDIFEFDSLDELREFDESYIDDTRSPILKGLAKKLNCKERDIVNIKALKDKDNAAIGFTCLVGNRTYAYKYADKSVSCLNND